ncbi:hypothetical protein JG688_00018345, partial [Phytophthora aleatoria]
MHRATAARMSRAMEAVTAMQEQQGITLGVITAHHVAVHHARQPDDIAVSIPNGNTTRQAQALDAELASLEERQQHQLNATENDCSEIEVLIFGVWVKVPVRISSLRAALRLPQYHIFSRGIFYGYVPHFPEPGGEDIPDS